jgi:hypothetical protein
MDSSKGNNNDDSNLSHDLSSVVPTARAEMKSLQTENDVVDPALWKANTYDVNTILAPQ